MTEGLGDCTGRENSNAAKCNRAPYLILVQYSTVKLRLVRKVEFLTIFKSKEFHFCIRFLAPKYLVGIGLMDIVEPGGYEAPLSLPIRS